MTNFVLIYSAGTIPETEEQQAQVMADWGAWYGKMGAAIVDGGNPFSRSVTIDVNGASEATQNLVATGYTVISAESLEDAVAACADHAHIKHGGSVTVYETFQM